MASVNNRITLQVSRMAFVRSVDAENDAGSIDLESAHHPPAGAKLTNSSLLAPTQARPTLPGINIEPFSGDIRDWRPFQNLFDCLVGESPTLSNVEKMRHLTSTLIGNAARFIGNLPVCGVSFKTAWVLLTKRYENKRFLITAQLDKLFSLKRIGKGTERSPEYNQINHYSISWSRNWTYGHVKIGNSALAQILTSRRTSSSHNTYQPVQGHRKASRLTQPHENHHGNPLTVHQPSRLIKWENLHTTVHAAQNLTLSCSVLSSDSMTRKNVSIGNHSMWSAMTISKSPSPNSGSKKEFQPRHKKTSHKLKPHVKIISSEHTQGV
ncbi:hypothetical protein MTP99_014298 [Tenebrio molitor]|nr:hypothetical protein MTP99_014298 [Tenebrio molitor]